MLKRRGDFLKMPPRTKVSMHLEKLKKGKEAKGKQVVDENALLKEENQVLKERINELAELHGHEDEFDDKTTEKAKQTQIARKQGCVKKLKHQNRMLKF